MTEIVYGPWQEGLSHTQRFNFTSVPGDNVSWAWDDAPYAHPTFDQFVNAEPYVATTRTSAQANDDFFYTPKPPDDLGAQPCLWSHAVRGHAVDFTWTGACSDLGPANVGLTNASNQSLSVGAQYDYTPSAILAPETIRWRNSFCSFTLPGSYYLPGPAHDAANRNIAPDDLPPGTWADFDPDSDLELESVTFNGYDADHPEYVVYAYMRAWQTGDPVPLSSWWPKVMDDGGTWDGPEPQNPKSVDNWMHMPGLAAIGPLGPGDVDTATGMALDSTWLDYLKPMPVGPGGVYDGHRMLDMAWQTSDMHEGALSVFHAPLTDSRHSYNYMATLSPPRFTLTYRTARWRTATYATPGLPPLRQWPRTDGLGASSTLRVWPPSRSAQGSNRVTGYV